MLLTQCSLSVLERMAVLGLTYQCHVSLILYFTEIIMMMATSTLCKSNLMQWPVVLCCGFEIFKLKL